MNFSFIIKTMITSFFVFLIIFALSFVSTQKNTNDSNNFGVKNTAKETLNIGELRTSGNITYNEEILLKSTIDNYLKNNNLSIDQVEFDIAVNNGTITVSIKSIKNMLEVDSNINSVFSYEITRK